MSPTAWGAATIVVGIWIALIGVLPVIAGLAGMHRVRRLRRQGVKTWAVAILRLDPEARGGIELEYTLTDGRVIQRPAPRAARKSAELCPGQSALIWYNPADPLDILVYGRDGGASNLVFATLGIAFILAGITIGAFAS